MREEKKTKINKPKATTYIFISWTVQMLSMSQLHIYRFWKVPSVRFLNNRPLHISTSEQVPQNWKTFLEMFFCSHQFTSIVTALKPATLGWHSLSLTTQKSAINSAQNWQVLSSTSLEVPNENVMISPSINKLTSGTADYMWFWLGSLRSLKSGGK